MDDGAYGDRERCGVAGILPVIAATDVVSSERVGGVDSAALDAPIAAKGVSLRVPPVSAGSRLDVEIAEGRSTAERAASARLLDQLNSAASSRLPQPATAAESCASCGRAERAALGSSAETARLPPERLLLVHPDSEISDRSGCSSQGRRTSMLEDLLSALGETLIVAGELHSRSESRAGRSVRGRL